MLSPSALMVQLLKLVLFSSSALRFLTLDQGFLHQVCACFQCGFPNLVKMPPLDSSTFERICVQMHVCCFQHGFPDLLKCLLILVFQPLSKSKFERICFGFARSDELPAYLSSQLLLISWTFEIKQQSCCFYKYITNLSFSPSFHLLRQELFTFTLRHHSLPPLPPLRFAWVNANESDSHKSCVTTRLNQTHRNSHAWLLDNFVVKRVQVQLWRWETESI